MCRFKTLKKINRTEILVTLQIGKIARNLCFVIADLKFIMNICIRIGFCNNFKNCLPDKTTKLKKSKYNVVRCIQLIAVQSLTPNK